VITDRQYLAVLWAFGLQRLVELGYSRRNERRIRRRKPDVSQAAAPLFKWIVLTNVGLFSLPVVERVIRGRRVPRVVATTGWLAALSALALRLAVLASLRDAWTARALVPADQVVIERGPYRFVRHPNYLALGLEFAGLPLIGGAYWSAVSLSLVNAALLTGRIRAEERLLDAIPGYRERMGHKGRFLPRIGALTGR
jgi:methyltransferase